MMADKVHRREFLSNSGKAVLGVGSGLTILADSRQPTADSRSARAAVATDRISLAMIGVRGRGNRLAEGFLQRDDCEITHVCDVNETNGTMRPAAYAVAQGGRLGESFSLQ